MSTVTRHFSALLLFLGFGASQAHAIPILQLYVEGGTYNSTTETWELSPAGSSNGEPFRLWAIGNVSGPGSKGTIYDVKLSAVYDSSVGPISISLTPTTADGDGNYLGFNDPSAPLNTGGWIQTVSDGSTPLLGDGSSLASHGEYGSGRTWQEFGLGDFSLSDSQIGDFINSFPTPGGYGAQINVYEVRVTGDFGEHPFTIHFDLYDHYVSGSHSKFVFAPFSHDGGGDGGVDVDVTIVPEPASTTLFGTAFLGIFGARWFNRRRKLNQLTA